MAMAINDRISLIESTFIVCSTICIYCSLITLMTVNVILYSNVSHFYSNFTKDCTQAVKEYTSLHQFNIVVTSIMYIYI